MDAAIAAKYNKLRSWVAMSDSMYEKFTAPPGPVDFEKAKKSVRDKELINSLEAFYATSTPPIETFAMPESEIVEAAENLKLVTEVDALFKEFIPVLEKEIEFLKVNKITMETSQYELKCNYPLIHEEIEDEIEAREWFKDTQWDMRKVEGAH